MKTKLDCVVIQHQGAEKVRDKISGLPIAEELKFWRERSMALRKQKEEMSKRYNVVEISA